METRCAPSLCGGPALRALCPGPRSVNAPCPGARQLCGAGTCRHRCQRCIGFRPQPGAAESYSPTPPCRRRQTLHARPPYRPQASRALR
eukprot:19399_4